MLKWLLILAQTVRSALKIRQDLALENIALRQQIAILKHKCPKPRLLAQRQNTSHWTKTRQTADRRSGRSKERSSNASECTGCTMNTFRWRHESVVQIHFQEGQDPLAVMVTREERPKSVLTARRPLLESSARQAEHPNEPMGEIFSCP